MNKFVGTKADLDKLSNHVDAVLEVSKIKPKKVGGGVHCPPELVPVQTYGKPTLDKDGKTWYMPAGEIPTKTKSDAIVAMAVSVVEIEKPAVDVLEIVKEAEEVAAVEPDGKVVPDELGK
jgi:hypothetical protein